MIGKIWDEINEFSICWEKRNLLSIKENQLLFNRNPFCSAEICDKFGKTIKIFQKKRQKCRG